ncbi:Scr1 family TA system antitoxin-like transcriptional regulator [Streptomyces sp. M19]
MDEYALTRRFVDQRTLRGQLEHLLAAGEEPRTVIQVIPNDAPAHPGLAGPFHLLGFDQGKTRDR